MIMTLPFADAGYLYFCAFLLPVFLYAEIHYKFRLIPSRYRIQAPEIIADVPSRLEPGEALPVLLLVKDAHRWPVQINGVRVGLSGGHGPARSLHLTLNERIRSQWWHRVLYMPRHFEDAGVRLVTVEIEAGIAGKTYRFQADNYRLTQHQPFRVCFAAEPLPLQRHYYTGDLHTHSWYTSDQVEFGAPVTATAELAQAMGHHFLAITDHSYDLDDLPENYLRNDPDLRKWQSFQREVAHWNAQNDFVIIPGEEVSCGNSRGGNVHFLVFNNPRYIPGQGDSGEKWLRYRPDLSIGEVMQRAGNDTLHFAAHPLMPVPLLQRLLLNRDRWQEADFTREGLHGLQVWNGHPDGTVAARDAWVRLLLQGKRALIIAGSDAHGNFARYRQITLPHIGMQEQEHYHLFGSHRTLLYLEEKPALDAVIRALRSGAAAVTSGPFLSLTARTATGEMVPMGGTLPREDVTLEVLAFSTPEFGLLHELRLLRGDLEQGVETEILREYSPAGEMAFRIRLPVAEQEHRHSYYRAEVTGNTAVPIPVQAMTNAIWG